MKIAARFASAFVALLFILTSAMGQTPQDASILLSHPGFEYLKTDLKNVLDLTLPAEQEQWANIEGYIDTLSEGVDGKRPVYVNVVTGTKPNALLIWAPLTDKNFKSFRENLESLGYTVTRDNKDTNLYQVEQEDTEYGFARVIPASGYCGLVLTSEQKDDDGKKGDKGPSKEEAVAVLKDLITRSTPPSSAIEGNMIAELSNSDDSEAGQKHRREAYAEVRRTSMDVIKKRPEESSTEFELRRLAVEQQLDEGERMLAELSKVTATLKLDAADSASLKSALVLAAKPIAGSSLDTATKQFGTQPDIFGSIGKEQGSALSVRVNHPIDPMRQKNAAAFLDAVQKDVEARTVASKERSESEKAAINKSTAGVLNVLRASIKAGWANGFVESIPDGKGEFYSIAAFAAPAAADLNSVLPDLAGAARGNVVEMNIDKQGDVAIHRVVMAEGVSDLFDRVFGVNKDIFVGVSASQIWIASGLDAKERLKKTIAGIGAPVSSDCPVHVEVNLLPIIQRLDDIAKTDAPGKTPEEQEGQRSRARTRARAIAAMKDGGDQAVMKFKVANGEITGEITLETGVLRWIGKMMSAFSAENFE
ncbi:MAG: hypothetical protein ACK58L_18505 [Planctomycetota bacterium]